MMSLSCLLETKLTWLRKGLKQRKQSTMREGKKKKKREDNSKESRNLLSLFSHFPIFFPQDGLY